VGWPGRNRRDHGSGDHRRPEQPSPTMRSRSIPSRNPTTPRRCTRRRRAPRPTSGITAGRARSTTPTPRPVPKAGKPSRPGGIERIASVRRTPAYRQVSRLRAAPAPQGRRRPWSNAWRTGCPSGSPAPGRVLFSGHGFRAASRRQRSTHPLFAKFSRLVESPSRRSCSTRPISQAR